MMQTFSRTVVIFSWVVDTFFADSKVAQTLGLGKRIVNGSSGVIDIEATPEVKRLPQDSKKRR